MGGVPGGDVADEDGCALGHGEQCIFVYLCVWGQDALCKALHYRLGQVEVLRGVSGAPMPMAGSRCGRILLHLGHHPRGLSTQPWALNPVHSVPRRRYSCGAAWRA